MENNVGTVGITCFAQVAYIIHFFSMLLFSFLRFSEKDYGKNSLINREKFLKFRIKFNFKKFSFNNCN